MNNHVENNQIRNFFSRYNLEKTKENFKILKKVKFEKKEYLIYQKIFKLIEIIDSKSKSITIEIDAENNSILLDDIVNKFFIEKIYQKRVEKKLATVTFWGIYSLL